MPYADPEEQRRSQREIQRDRSRGVAIFRAALICRAEYPDDDQMWGRLTRMIDAELVWREQQGYGLPGWPAQREQELLQMLPAQVGES